MIDHQLWLEQPDQDFQNGPDCFTEDDFPEEMIEGIREGYSGDIEYLHDYMLKYKDSFFEMVAEFVEDITENSPAIEFFQCRFENYFRSIVHCINQNDNNDIYMVFIDFLSNCHEGI